MKSNPYKMSGIKKYKDFDLGDAIEDFKKGLEISPTDVPLHFNIACAYSLTEKKALAYHHIAKAVSHGLKDVEKIMSHDDLAFVRIQPEFDAFRQSGFNITPYPLATPEKTASLNAVISGNQTDWGLPYGAALNLTINLKTNQKPIFVFVTVPEKLNISGSMYKNAFVFVICRFDKRTLQYYLQLKG